MARSSIAPLAVLLAVTILTCGGCAVYQYQLVEPPEIAGPIDREGMTFTIDPLEYYVAEHWGRLAMRIANLSDEPITLLGERSYIVDPTGETRSLFGGTIAPGSHITMILPPQIHTVRPGPRFGVGIGAGVGVGRFGMGAYHSPWRHHPVYVREVVPIWRWDRGDVYLWLVYERDDERFAHDLHFERIKVK